MVVTEVSELAKGSKDAALRMADLGNGLKTKPQDPVTGSSESVVAVPKDTPEALYLALAVGNDCQFVSANERLVRKIRQEKRCRRCQPWQIAQCTADTSSRA